MAVKYRPLITIKEKTPTEAAQYQSLSTEVEGTEHQVKVTPISNPEFNGEDYQVGLVNNVRMPGQYVGLPVVTTPPENSPVGSLFILEKNV